MSDPRDCGVASFSLKGNDMLSIESPLCYHFPGKSVRLEPFRAMVKNRIYPILAILHYDEFLYFPSLSLLIC